MSCLLLLVTRIITISNYGNFSKAEYTLALRLESELSDLRVGYTNPYSKHKCFECARCVDGTKIKT